MGRANLQKYSRAFALPTVLITSITMLTVLVTTLSAATSISAGLKNQYANQLARTASQSGMTMAQACMEGNNGTITWTNAMPLKPNTDCTGTETTSCPNTATAAACYVLKSGNYRTTFKVKVITDSSDNPIDISTEGIVREVRKTSGEVITENKTSLKAKLQGVSGAGGTATTAEGSLVATNAGTCSIADGTLYCWGYSGYGQMGSSSSYVQTPTAVAGALAGKTVTKVSSSSDTNPNNLYGHTCAVAEGSLYCWGYNGYYQVGNGNTTTQYAPVLIAGGLAGKTVTDVLAFNMGTCAIADGTLYCWGYGYYGQLGTGSATSYVQTPTAVAGALAGKTVTKVSASADTSPDNGYAHTCAIADGSLYCWGYNGYYQVGNGSTSTQYGPQLVGGTLSGQTVTDVITFNTGTCAIANGTLYCWGYSGYGQLGTSTSYVQSPGSVAGAMVGKTVTKVSSTADLDPGNLYGHTCAIAGGQLYCWGYNGYYQIGNGNTTTQYSPILIGGGLAGKTVTDVFTFNAGTCAVADGTLYCWGYSGYGQLGSSSSYVQTPTAVSGTLAGKTVTKVSASADTNPNNLYGHTCVIASQSLHCTGYNGYYQIGNGNSTTQYTPVQVGGGGLLQGAIPAISLDRYHSCAIASDNKAYCWGYNGTGGLGDSTTSTSYVPVAVAQGAMPSGATIKNISVADYRSTCAIASDNKAYCWGYNGYGGLGNNSTSTSYVPVAVSQGAMSSGATVKGIDVGYYHTCAIASDDKAYCWGYNSHGNLGNNSTSDSYVPVAVSQGAMPSGATVKKITVGAYHTCAIASDDKAYCWGYNSNGQLGNNSTSNSYVPVAVSQGAMPSGATIKKIAAGYYYTCAIASDDKAYCWGDNSASSSYTPVAIAQGAMPAGATIKDITVGYYHACAIASDDKAYCWGYNSYGGLGNNTTTASSTPVAVAQGVMPSLATIKSITAGYHQTCAIASNNKAYCWGYNGYGNLGNNTTTNSSTPVQVLQAPSWGTIPPPQSGGGETQSYLKLTY